MRRLKLMALAATLLATASCESDLIPGLDGEPNVVAMRLSIGLQTITINSSGNVTGGPIQLPLGSTLTVSATFLDPEGDPDPNVTQASFQLNVTSSGSVVFQRNNVNPFVGTLTAGSAGVSQTSFTLYNLETQEQVFGPWPVTTVTN
jgi:hypothetical protein